jgi:hypothetical protein
MSVAPPLETIPVGIIVERTKGLSQWADYIWRPVIALAGQPDTAPWTKISEEDDHAAFYAGPAEIELHRSETTNYRDNLASGAPALWVALRETGGEPPYELYLVTADPAEGEALTAAGNDIVETVPMPDSIRDRVEAFVAEHHVEREFVKRKRDRANIESLGRRPPATRRNER